jgi:hypothetical protein
LSLPEFPVDFQDWPLVSDGGMPANPLQALMEAAPNTEPAETLLDFQLFKEAVTDCIDTLSAQDRYIIEAVLFERLTFRPLGARLGLSHEHARRLYKKALERLAVPLSQHPTIIKRYPMLKSDAAENYEEPLFAPTDWREAARQELLWLAPDGLDGTLTMDQLIAKLNEQIEEAFTRLHNGAPAIGQWDFDAILDLLCRKQSDYGHKNILRARFAGLVVRSSDKVARIENITAKGGTSALADEPLEDAFIDIVGYAVIGRMLAYGTFELDLPEQVAA